MRYQHLALCVSVAAALAAGSAHGNTITVTQAGDAGTAGTCTLRQAVDAANNDSAGSSTCAAGSDSDTIVFAAALNGATITLTGELPVSAALTISGSGQTLDGNQAGRILRAVGVHGSTPFDVIASNVTLANGHAIGSGVDGSGGAVYARYANVVLSNVTLSGNSSDRWGGAVFALNGGISVTNCNVINNTSGYRGGGIATSASAVTVKSSTISGNTAQSGGGVYLSQYGGSNPMLISHSTISANSVGCTYSSCGGGMDLINVTANVIDSTVSGNSADGGGFTRIAGAVNVLNGVVSFTNTTVYGNSATGTAQSSYVTGGVLQNRPPSATSAVLSLTNVTISGNQGGPAGSSVSGGLMSGVSGNAYFGSVVLANTIVSGNSPSGADVLLGDAPSATASNSLLGSGAQGIAQFSSPSLANVFSDAPGLSPLQSNGGATKTLALTATSPALGAGSVALATFAGNALLYDQRGAGHPRTYGGRVDIGAFQAARDRVFTSGFEPDP